MIIHVTHDYIDALRVGVREQFCMSRHAWCMVLHPTHGSDEGDTLKDEDQTVFRRGSDEGLSVVNLLEHVRAQRIIRSVRSPRRSEAASRCGLCEMLAWWYSVSPAGPVDQSQWKGMT